MRNIKHSVFRYMPVYYNVLLCNNVDTCTIHVDAIKMGRLSKSVPQN